MAPGAASGSPTALVLVDVQNDFCPGGSLAVRRGDEVVAPLNRLAAALAKADALVVATRDWHPPGHASFAERGGPWPPHCVQGTRGGAFHPDLVLPKGAVVVTKGQDPAVDAYSGFQGTAPDGATLEATLRARGVARLLVGGLATDYCVRATALDARRLGFDVVVLEDAVRAVDVRPGDGARALAAMRLAGAALGRAADEARRAAARA